jgi:hypothetical protein
MVFRMKRKWQLVLLASGALTPQAIAQSYRCNNCTVTIFADEGRSSSAAATQQSSGQGSNLGHVFIELTNSDKQMYLGYYGDPGNPSRGQLRVDKDLFLNGDWDVSKTYQITGEGYNKVHEMIDQWAQKGQTWRPWCNCGDFAEAVATVAGLSFEGLPKAAGLSTPALWARYLREHGGTLNPQRSGTGFEGRWECNETGERVLITQHGGKYYATFFGVHWVLAKSGKDLATSQGLTGAEVAALFPEAPADVIRRFVGMPAVLVLTLSDSNHIFYATTAPRSISKDRRTGQLDLGAGATRAGTLTRSK